jgi:hypothetical protein
MRRFSPQRLRDAIRDRKNPTPTEGQALVIRSRMIDSHEEGWRQHAFAGKMIVRQSVPEEELIAVVMVSAASQRL